MQKLCARAEIYMKNTNHCTCDCEVIHSETVDKVKRMMPKSKDFYDLANLYKLFSV